MIEEEYQTKIIKDLGLKYSMSEETMRDLILSPFKLVAKIMSEGSNSKILINGFFKFWVKPNRIKKLMCNKTDEII